jgi:hypothetical protein
VIEIYRRFGGICCSRLQGIRISPTAYSGAVYNERENNKGLGKLFGCGGFA